MSFTLHDWLCNQQEICVRESCKCLLEQIFPRIFSNKHLLYALIWVDLNWFRIYFWNVSFSENTKHIQFLLELNNRAFSRKSPRRRMQHVRWILKLHDRSPAVTWSTFEVWANIQGNLWATSLLPNVDEISVILTFTTLMGFRERW